MSPTQLGILWTEFDLLLSPYLMNKSNLQCRQVNFSLVLEHTALSTGNANNITLFVYTGPFLNCPAWNPPELQVDNSSQLGVVTMKVIGCKILVLD